MPRIVFCNRFAYPDASATSQLLSDLALSLALRNMDVTLIAGQTSYVKGERAPPARSSWNGVKIRRIWSTRFRGSTLVGKAADYISFYIALAFHLFFFLKEDDVLIAKTDPPLLSVVCAWTARRRRAYLINWLQDLYPELAIATGAVRLHSKLFYALEAARNWSLGSAHANVTICEAMSLRLRRLGVDKASIVEIPNWVDEQKIVGVPPQDNELRRSLKLRRFVVGYSGNLGRAHDWTTVLEAAKILREYDDISFLMIGGGKGYEKLREEVECHHLQHMFTFRAYFDKSDLNTSLSIPDVHWISLKPECDGMLFPSKLYGIAAVGRPIIAITSPGGELSKLIDTFACGFSVAPGDAKSFSDAVLSVALDNNLQKEQGINARRLVDTRFSRKAALTAWQVLIGQYLA